MTTKHTPGPWKRNLQSSIERRNEIIAEGAIVARVCEFGAHSETPNAEEANARLIAEAGTVAHETGLTPRQLDDQRRELLGALEQVSKQLYDETGIAFKYVNDIIAKATVTGGAS